MTVQTENQVPVATKKFEPSVYQKAIFEFVQNGNGNAIVEAVAGSGKTTTIVKALEHATGSTVFLAFNKAIADELKKRGVNAMTFHGLCCSRVMAARQTRDIKADKVRQIIRATLSEQDNRVYGQFVAKLVGLARQAGIGCLVANEEQNWMEIVEQHELELEGSFSSGISMAMKILEESNKARSIDFDDMLYLAVLDNVPLPKFDFVFVDEAQDTNAIQRAILRKIMNEGSRLVAVGDPAQAIYGFRGADSNSLNLIAEEFSCVRLPLTVTYRCARSIVQYARQWVDHIECPVTAPVGVVSHPQWDIDSFRAKDLIVCRTTRPLISLGYKMLRARKPFYIMGKEIGAGLKSIIQRMKTTDMGKLAERIANWEYNECIKWAAQHNDSQIEATKDKASAIMYLMEGCESVEEIYSVIDQMFSEKSGGVVLATIHKSKGLEATRVWWLNYNQCPAKWAKLPWQQEQERNLCYVAATRAINELYLIEEE